VVSLQTAFLFPRFIQMVFLIYSLVTEMQSAKGTELKRTKSHRTLWTIQPNGRLGNLMGEYATLYVLAKLNGQQAYILPEMHKHLSKIFRVTLPVIRQDVADLIHLREYALHDWMSPEYYNIKEKHIMFTGYPCSWTFYHNIREQILREFTFHDFIKQDVDSRLRRLKTDDRNVTFVGVHVRRGDYVDVMRDVWKGVLADKKYLRKAMDYFRNKYNNTLFLVTSNDMDWCKSHIDNFLGDVHFVGDGKEDSPANDFVLLAHCNHTIMTIGTFGYWVGYLIGGETVYLSNFTASDSTFLNVFKYEAAFLPEWIGIPADLSPLLR
uniref:L-Fucosyltransferase n=1 Tax=Leptobrachium leishanense TaxID=445787 RepID=A0A8C5QZD3_9ANUR